MLIEAPLHAAGMAMALLAMAKERAERRAGAALLAARDAADRASDAKSRFVAHLSHELRTPMNGVLGMAQVLAADPRLLADQKLKAETLERAGRHLVAVAGNVLDLAKAEAGTLEVGRWPVPLGELLLDCEALTRAAAEEKGQRFHVATGTGVPDAVLGDATRLRQVVLNLLSNAIKFTPAGGSIDLQASTGEAGRVRIQVVDTGPGIPPEARGRLFREFSQLGGTSSAAGAGLGLAISRSLIQAMGGGIGHEVGPDGRGSSFWIELPAAGPVRPARDEESPQTPHLAGIGGARLRFLVVDDIPANRMIARLLLQRAGHSVVEATTAEQAVEAVATGGFDAVLMDALMPGTDGLEATRRIRALPGEAGQVRIIAVTADVRPALVQECLAAGMDGCLAKPLDSNALFATLSRLGPEIGGTRLEAA